MDSLMSGVTCRLSSVEAAILTREAYETSYGIANHDVVSKSQDAESVFGLVLKRWSEDTVGPSRLCERLDVFLDRKIYEKTGVSWDKFLDQSISMNDLIIDRIDASIAAEVKRLADLQAKMEDEKKKASEKKS